MNSRSKAMVPLLCWGGIGAVLVLLPVIVGDSYLLLTVDFYIMALFALSYNLLLGQSGMLSFGHATYYGLGAYALAALQSKLGLPFWAGLIASPIVAAVAALAIGWFSVRVTGMYFAMLTLAFSQFVVVLVTGWYSFTGGDDGMPLTLPDWMLVPRNCYYFSLVIVAVCVWLIHRITISPFGTALGAVRDNRTRAIYIGLSIRKMQLRIFVVAGAFAGVAGGLRAILQQMAFPSLLDWSQSADPLLMTLAGGLHVFSGPIMGAAVFVFANFAVTSQFEYSLLVFGTLVLLIVLFLPGGIVGSIHQLIGSASRKSCGEGP